MRARADASPFQTSEINCSARTSRNTTRELNKNIRREAMIMIPSRAAPRL